MARIIESNGRRIIKMSVNDIISVVQDYQRIVPRFSTAEGIRKYRIILFINIYLQSKFVD